MKKILLTALTFALSTPAAYAQATLDKPDGNNFAQQINGNQNGATPWNDAPQTQPPLEKAAANAVVQQVETYLNGLTTLQADFIQTHSDGSRYNGVFSLNRPGRLRFEYAPPVGDYIVADGLLIHYWDSEIKNYSNAPIGSTLADFLLRKTIRLSGDLTVQSVQDVPDNRWLLTLSQTADPKAGNLTLLVEKDPMRLVRWRIIDGTGAMTEVSLFKIQTGLHLDPKLFIFKTPKGYESETDKR